MKISVSSYSFSQYIKAGKMTQFDCVKKAKEMGFDAIEFINIVGDTLAEQKENAAKIREEAKKVGIEKLEEEFQKQEIPTENIQNKHINTKENENEIEVELIYEVLEKIGSEEKIIF